MLVMRVSGREVSGWEPSGRRGCVNRRRMRMELLILGIVMLRLGECWRLSVAEGRGALSLRKDL